MKAQPEDSGERSGNTLPLNRNKETGSVERMIPGKVEETMEAEHVERYLFAGGVASGLVLDIGCGVAYGSRIMTRAQSVVGIDVDVEALEYGKRRFGSEKLELVASEASHLPFRDSAFDCTVGFEIVEHVPQPASMVAEVARVCKRGAVIVLSTPNKLISSPISKKPLNPYHIQEFYPSGFVAMVGAYLSVTSVYGQIRCNKFITPYLGALYNILVRLFGISVVTRVKPGGRGAVSERGRFRVTRAKNWYTTLATTVVLARKE